MRPHALQLAVHAGTLWSQCMPGTQRLRQPAKLKLSYDLQQTWLPPMLRLLSGGVILLGSCCGWHWVCNGQAWVTQERYVLKLPQQVAALGQSWCLWLPCVYFLTIFFFGLLGRLAFCCVILVSSVVEEYLWSDLFCVEWNVKTNFQLYCLLVVIPGLSSSMIIE